MSEQDAGEACIPAGVLETERTHYLLTYVREGGAVKPLCGAYLSSKATRQCADLGWYMHPLDAFCAWQEHVVALAPAQGPAATLTPEELGSLQSAVGACVDAGEDYLPTQRALGQMLDKYYARALAQGTAPSLSGQLRRSFEAMERGEQPESWESLQAKAQGAAGALPHGGLDPNEVIGGSQCPDCEGDGRDPKQGELPRYLQDECARCGGSGSLPVTRADADDWEPHEPASSTAGALPAAVVALLVELRWYVESRAVLGSLAAKETLMRLDGWLALAGQPDAATSEPDYSRCDPALE